jgi:hypothetical protein
MASLARVRRGLLYGIIVGALTVHATAANAPVGTPPAPAVAAGGLLYGDGRDGSATLLQYVHWGRFCRWHAGHRLCAHLVGLRHFCDRRPNHPLCDDDDEDRFCRRHPHHPLCHDKPPSPS